MNAFVKWGFRAVGLLSLLIIVALIVIYMVVTRSIPDYNRSFTTSYGDYNVEIIRDRNAVPHIYGSNFEQALFGLGIAHAQERLWQMVMLRRAAQGRISEIAGEDLVQTDLFLRNLDLWNLSSRQVPRLKPETQKFLQAYADGVNAQIANINENKLGTGAPEFFLINSEIAPWTPADSVAIQKLMALQMSSGAQNEILRTKLSTILTPEEMKDIEYEAYAPQIARNGTTLSTQTDAPDILAALSPIGYGRNAGASNAFAVTPNRSTSQKAILASDPHLKLTAPAIWMLAHLSDGKNNYVGGSIPGMPLILIGHNNDLAWGLTTSNLDDQDLVIIRTDPNDRSQYETSAGLIPFDAREILINVKGETEPRRFVGLSTQYGPVIPSHGPWEIENILPHDHLAALSWTALSEEDKSFDAAFDMVRSTNVRRAIAVLEDHLAPAQMFTFADSSGNIGQVAAGKMPQRSPSNPSQGSLPAVSWAGDAGFEGFFPYAENPKSINPTSGLVLHTNNKFIDQPYPKHYSFDWGDNYRIKRAQGLIAGRKIHSTESFIEAQNDAISEDARALLPLIAGPFWFQPDQEGQKAEALKMLGEWNGKFDAFGPEALIYSTWISELNELVFRDELGSVLDEMGQTDPFRLERVYRNVGGASKWCDVKPTPEKESCAYIADIALEKTLERLSAVYGDDLNTWRWGKAHKALHENETLGGIPLLGLFANITQEVSGGSQTLLRTASKSDNPFDFTAVHGASLRMVVNFADLQHAKFIISTGQSGNILSKHYDDLSVLWAAGEYIDIPTDREMVEASQIGIMNVTTAVNADMAPTN